MLKLIPAIFLTLTFFSGAANASSTLKEVNATQINSFQKIGHVSVSGVRGSPDDAIRKLQDKVLAKGGSHYRIISLDTSGDSSLWRAVASVYIM